MRLLVVVLVCTAGLSAQVAQPDASAKLRQFEQNLANAMKLPGAALARTAPQILAASQVCAIPLLQVGPDATFHSNMPVIAPDSKVEFAARAVVPPSPVCEEHAWK
jgi:predicted component of type VI protein secretion system